MKFGPKCMGNSPQNIRGYTDIFTVYSVQSTPPPPYFTLPIPQFVYFACRSALKTFN